MERKVLIQLYKYIYKEGEREIRTRRIRCMDNVGNENIYIYIQEGKLNKFNTLVFVDIQRQWFPTRYNEYKL